MKRIISLVICLAVMLPATLIRAFSYGELDDLVTTTNKMVFTTNQNTYRPGDEIIITASMESIWGNPDLVGDVFGYDRYEFPGAYGMNALIATLIFPTETFTPKGGKTFEDGSSTILNFNKNDCRVSVNKTALSKAKAYGYYTFTFLSGIFNEYEDRYAFFNGSGDLCQFKLTVNENAVPGVYKLPIGPYYSALEISDITTPDFEFFGQSYYRFDGYDSNYNPRPCDYGAGYGSDVAYIEIVVKGEHTAPDDPSAIKTVSPTCTEGGYTSYVCTDCGKTITEKYDPTGHTLSDDPDDTIKVPVTCIRDGYTSVLCTTCNEHIVTETYTKTGHTPSTNKEDISYTPPTCTEDGSEIIHCSVCKSVAKVIIRKKLYHRFENVQVDATCTEDGYYHTKCSNDGCDVETEKISIPMLCHKNSDGTDAYGDAVIEVKPTTTSAGCSYKECSLCDDKQYEEIPVLDIIFGDCDMNGTINLCDISVMLKHLSGKENIYFSPENADVTHDGDIGLADAIKILKYIAKWEIDLEV